MLQLKKGRRGGTAEDVSGLKETKQTQCAWCWIGFWFEPKGKSGTCMCTEYLDNTTELLLVLSGVIMVMWLFFEEAGWRI